MDQAECLKQVFGVLMDPNAVEDESYPQWVRNIIKQLRETVLKPLMSLLDADPKDLESIGKAFGARKHIDTITGKLPSIDEDILEKIDFGDLQGSIDQFEKEADDLPKLEKKIQREVDDAGDHEASKFYRGKSVGLEFLQDEEGYWKGFRPNTKVLIFMLGLWPEIEEKCKTRRDLYEYLLRKIWRPKKSSETFSLLMVEADPPEEIGSYERVERILERIGFNPAKPGRPKKN